MYEAKINSCTLQPVLEGAYDTRHIYVGQREASATIRVLQQCKMIASALECNLLRPIGIAD